MGRRDGLVARPQTRPIERASMYTHHRRDPFAVLFDDVFADAFRAPRAARAVRARFDVIERGNVYAAIVDLPGVKKEDIQIEVHGKRVSIAAAAKKLRETKEGERVLVAERHEGEFQRRFELPVEIAEDKVEAVYADGVLTVTLPKKEAAQAKRVDVH